MWEFRRDPKDLSPQEQAQLEALFAKLPPLRKLHQARLHFKEIFDQAPHRKKAAYELCKLHLQILDDGLLGLDDFFRTYEDWQEEILNYFDARQTSAAVEGVNNKARVITKRAYGLKSAESLWTRLILDLNRAREAVGRTIAQMKSLVAGFRVVFGPLCT
jgi:transposase